MADEIQEAEEARAAEAARAAEEAERAAAAKADAAVKEGMDASPQEDGKADEPAKPDSAAKEGVDTSSERGDDRRPPPRRPTGLPIGERMEDLDRHRAEELADKYFPEASDEQRDARIREGMDRLAENREEAGGASMGGKEGEMPEGGKYQEWKLHDKAAEGYANLAGMELGNTALHAVVGSHEAGSLLEGEGGETGNIMHHATEAKEHFEQASEYRSEMLSERAAADKIRSEWSQELSGVKHELQGLQNLEDANLDDDKLKEHFGGTREEFEDRIHELEERRKTLEAAMGLTA